MNLPSNIATRPRVTVYAYATLGKRRRLSWRYLEAADESAALRAARAAVGPDRDIYAGPLTELCQARDCRSPAAKLAGFGAWCPLCLSCAAGPFPFQLK